MREIFDLHFWPGLALLTYMIYRPIFDNPVAPFRNGLDLDIHYLTFLKVLRDGFGAGLPLADRAVAPAGIATEDHDPVVLHKPVSGLPHSEQMT